MILFKNKLNLKILNYLTNTITDEHLSFLLFALIVEMAFLVINQYNISKFHLNHINSLGNLMTKTTYLNFILMI